MNLKSFTFTLFIVSYSLFTITACGYKPTSYYTKNEISGLVFVNLHVNINYATNSVSIKDTVNEMVIKEFGATLTDNKTSADTLIDIRLDSISFSTLEVDDQGYVTLYRTKVIIKFIYTNVKSKKTKTLKLSAYDDYSVDTDSVITDTNKRESVKIASQKALSEIFSKIAIQSFKTTDEDKRLAKIKEDEKNEEEQNKSKSYFFFK